jgi:hypothetical protein
MTLHRSAGLPDGIFSKQKCRFWFILESVGMENVGLFMVISYVLRLFGICMAIWFIVQVFGTFLTFWYIVPRKIWQPFLSVEVLGTDGTLRRVRIDFVTTFTTHRTRSNI